MSQAGTGRGPGWRGGIGKSLPLAVIWVPLLINAAHVVGFTVWTTWLSFTTSELLPEYDWAGLRSYRAVARTENIGIAYIHLVLYRVGVVVLAARLRFFLAVRINLRL